MHPRITLSTNDLDIFTKTSDWSITAGNFNFKRPLWNNWTANRSGRILYDHAQLNDYIIQTPDSPTRFPSSLNPRADVVDIALNKSPFQTRISNLNEHFSDYNPILFDSPFTTFPPCPLKFINWKKYTDILSNQTADINPTTTLPSNIDSAITNFTIFIQAAMKLFTFTPNRTRKGLTLLPEIQEKTYFDANGNGIAALILNVTLTLKFHSS